MLLALEKSDAEEFALLRSSHELIMLDEVRKVKDNQISEAQAAWDSLKESKKVIEERKAYYEKLVNDGLNGWETGSLIMTGGAIVADIAGTALRAIASGMSIIPDVQAGAAGFGGSPTVTITIGGTKFALSLTGAADFANGIANILQIGAGMTATIGNYNRRAEEWDFQKLLAIKELPQIDKQITAADIRYQITVQ